MNQRELTRGSINLMMSTVEQLLGAPLHHYVYTNFEGFKKIVDVFGGITVDVQERMLHDDIYNPINIYPGRQPLNGEQALGSKFLVVVLRKLTMRWVCTLQRRQGR